MVVTLDQSGHEQGQMLGEDLGGKADGLVRLMLPLVHTSRVSLS